MTDEEIKVLEQRIRDDGRILARLSARKRDLLNQVSALDKEIGSLINERRRDEERLLEIQFIPYRKSGRRAADAKTIKIKPVEEMSDTEAREMLRLLQQRDNTNG